MANRTMRTAKNVKFNNRNQNNKIKKRQIIRKTARNGLDARQTIIQKKRKNVVDARDILAKRAKTQDARTKLVQLRRSKGPAAPLNSNVQVIGNNILRKTDRNGKISLVTNKSKQTTTDINFAIKQQLGLIPPSRNTKKMNFKHTNNTKLLSRNFAPTLISKTIFNDEFTRQQNYEQFARGYQQAESLYRWVRPDPRPAPAPRRQLLRNELPESNGAEWRSYPTLSARPARAPAAYIDLDAVMDDEDMPLAPPVRQTISLQGSSRLSNVHSRLDSYPPEPESHGILSQTKTKVVVPAGHRIVVSNLQTTVTQDDIKELFEDIGQLLVARLVRPGTAEVIYKNLRDAQKAVDTYHNRQLDGQPMKCLLVNKRPLNNPTAPALTTVKNGSQGIMQIPRATNASNNKLVPDVSTIHKVLFQRK